MVNLSSDLPTTPEGSRSPPVCCERDDLDHQGGGDLDDHDEDDTADDGTCSSSFLAV